MAVFDYCLVTQKLCKEGLFFEFCVHIICRKICKESKDRDFPCQKKKDRDFMFIY